MRVYRRGKSSLWVYLFTLHTHANSNVRFYHSNSLVNQIFQIRFDLATNELWTTYLLVLMAYANNLTAHKADLYGLHGTFNYSDQNIGPILTLLDLKPGEHLIDLGCGDGVLSDRLAQIVGENGRIAGTDSNQGMVGLKEIPVLQVKSRTRLTRFASSITF